MNARTGRTWARLAVGAIAVLAASAFASPAYADTTADLEVELTGTTLSPGSDGKFGSLSILNHGPSDASNVTLAFDISALDDTKVELFGVECGEDADVIICDGLTIKNGEDADFIFPLIKAAGATPGAAGALSVTVTHEGTDPDLTNNSVTVDVVISDSAKPDLTVVAFDVYKVDGSGDPGEITDQPIPPGGTSNLWILVLNQGDETANGLKLSITLPEHVTFTTPEPGDCTHAAGDGTTVCDYDDVVLTEAGTDDSEGFFFFEVKVSEDAVGPAALTGGLATVEALATGDPVEIAPAAQPRNFSRALGIIDVDETDNTDDFTVFVAGPGGQGPLPETGVKVGLIAGAGVVTMALGVLLFVAARRRRQPA